MYNPFTHITKAIKDYLGKRRVRKAIQRYDAQLKENLKDFNGSGYTKIKFDCKLSDYQYTIVLKTIEWIKGFGVTPSLLQTIWEKYKLPSPISSCNYDELLDEINNHCFFCIQDDNCKRYVDYFHHRHYMPSIMLNELIRNVDNSIAKYRAEEVKDSAAIENLSYTLTQSLILINSNISQSHLNSSFELGQDPDFEEFRSFIPNRNYFENARLLHCDVTSVVNLQRYLPDKTPTKALKALNAHLLLEKHLCAFSALCGLMLDAAAGTRHYFDPLRSIENHIRLIFHDSELYRLELPASPVDTTVAIGSRGANAHTTIMKLYLIDSNDKRIIVRIDLPHVRNPKFHFKVVRPDDAKYTNMNHAEIEAANHDDSLLQVLEILKDSIKEQMPHMFIVQDTQAKEEKMILTDMEKLITYRHMCQNYIVGKDYNKQLKKVAGYFRMSGSSIESVLEKATEYYSV